MAKPNPSPRYGRLIGGNRSSILFTKSAVPPTGKPEDGSRGPAWFNPNPRCELPPPAKKSSGRGMRWIPEQDTFVGHAPGGKSLVPLTGCSKPILVERAKTY